MNLCVIVLSNDLKRHIKPPKYQPKICYKIDEKSIVEICLDTVIKLNPKLIILMVSKHEILFINKVIKYVNYAKLISYCIYDNLVENYTDVKMQKISLAETCYSGHDVLVIPGNCPTITLRSLSKMVNAKRNVKINDNFFFLPKENLHYLRPSIIDADLSLINTVANETDFIDEKEIKSVETSTDYEEAIKIFDKKKSFFKKFSRIRKNHSI